MKWECTCCPRCWWLNDLSSALNPMSSFAPSSMKALVSNASTQTMLFAGRCIHRKLVAFDSVGRMFTAGFLGLMASRPYRTSYTVRFVTLLSLWKLPKSTMVALNPLQAPKASSLSDSTLFEGASNRTMSRLLFWAARRNGVIPNESLAVRLTSFLSRRHSTTSRCPASAATCSGVMPFNKRALISASAPSNRRTTLTVPCLHALCKGVQLPSLFAMTSAPCVRSNSTISSRPCAMARWIAAFPLPSTAFTLALGDRGRSSSILHSPYLPVLAAQWRGVLLPSSWPASPSSAIFWRSNSSITFEPQLQSLSAARLCRTCRPLLSFLLTSAPHFSSTSTTWK
ncbi:hypothetical protein B5807_10130 [Epicoccum nigrum]|uniref:Uncharacterized protein n=1 Tax=Epicoccum nigrum TaxID=105696 RepID=A0A1Y2LNL0_EPING|nr:hypothetical protein B5807_10130 [Epicoccum nigrum]